MLYRTHILWILNCFCLVSICSISQHDLSPGEAAFLFVICNVSENIHVFYWPCQSLPVWPNDRRRHTEKRSLVSGLCGQNQGSADGTEHRTAGTPPADNCPPPCQPEEDRMEEQWTDRVMISFQQQKKLNHLVTYDGSDWSRKHWYSMFWSIYDNLKL